MFTHSFELRPLFSEPYAKEYAQYNFPCSGSQNDPIELLNCSLEKQAFKTLIEHGDM